MWVSLCGRGSGCFGLAGCAEVALARAVGGWMAVRRGDGGGMAGHDGAVC